MYVYINIQRQDLRLETVTANTIIMFSLFFIFFRFIFEDLVNLKKIKIKIHACKLVRTLI